MDLATEITMLCCTKPVLVRNLKDLQCLPKSVLRLEARSHGLPIASSKAKQQIVEQLCGHYSLCHTELMDIYNGDASDISSSSTLTDFFREGSSSHMHFSLPGHPVTASVGESALERCSANQEEKYDTSLSNSSQEVQACLGEIRHEDRWKGSRVEVKVPKPKRRVSCPHCCQHVAYLKTHVRKFHALSGDHRKVDMGKENYPQNETEGLTKTLRVKKRFLVNLVQNEVEKISKKVTKEILELSEESHVLQDSSKISKKEAICDISVPSPVKKMVARLSSVSVSLR